MTNPGDTTRTGWRRPMAVSSAIEDPALGRAERWLSSWGILTGSDPLWVQPDNDPFYSQATVSTSTGNRRAMSSTSIRWNTLKR
jgi:hypothetical protein